MARMTLPDTAELKNARLLGTLAAGAFVAGITALIAIQSGDPHQAPTRGVASELDFPRAPARDLSLPTTEREFADRTPEIGEPVSTF